MKKTFYIFGGVLYALAFILMTFVAPYRADIPTGLYSTKSAIMMNIPTMIYSVLSVLVGSMFFILGKIEAVYNRLQQPEQLKEDNGESEQSTESNEVDNGWVPWVIWGVLLVLAILAGMIMTGSMF